MVFFTILQSLEAAGLFDSELEHGSWIILSPWEVKMGDLEFASSAISS